VDIRSNIRAMYKLKAAAESAKHTLSTNQTASIHVESLHEGMDFQYTLSRCVFYVCVLCVSVGTVCIVYVCACVLCECMYVFCIRVSVVCVCVCVCVCVWRGIRGTDMNSQCCYVYPFVYFQRSVM